MFDNTDFPEHFNAIVVGADGTVMDYGAIIGSTHDLMERVALDPVTEAAFGDIAPMEVFDLLFGSDYGVDYANAVAVIMRGVLEYSYGVVSVIENTPALFASEFSISDYEWEVAASVIDFHMDEGNDCNSLSPGYECSADELANVTLAIYLFFVAAVHYHNLASA